RQLTDGLHLLRLSHRLARSFYLFLSLLSLRHIAGNFGVSDQFAIGRANGIDDDIGPEFRTVLAIAPSFLFETALPQGRVQANLRDAGCGILRAVELGEMLSDDFLRRVTLDALGAG